MSVGKMYQGRRFACVVGFMFKKAALRVRTPEFPRSANGVLDWGYEKTYICLKRTPYYITDLGNLFAFSTDKPYLSGEPGTGPCHQSAPPMATSHSGCTRHEYYSLPSVGLVCIYRRELLSHQSQRSHRHNYRYVFHVVSYGCLVLGVTVRLR